MKLNFMGQLDDLREGLLDVAADLGIELDGGGLSVQIEKTEGRLAVGMTQGKAYIRFEKKNHFFRALGLLAEELKKHKEFHREEEPRFSTIGVMIDVSRNAVLRVESIKLILRKMALMGMNMAMLYSEDTYEIKSSPYFGYMRGRYTHEELAECDRYAALFDIEMVPCIQTLAHLSEALKWRFSKDFQDTSDILLVGEPRTYAFIEEMIKAATSPFRSKRVHLGMDEAHNLGLGRYLDINGYRMRFDIMNEHLTKVQDIALKMGLEPMIWSDMFFRLGSSIGEYYDREAQIPQEAIDKIPHGLQLVYWDYYHDDEESYQLFIQKHKTMGSDIVFAGGLWTWNGMVVNYPKAFRVTDSGLKACKKEGIKEVFATMWGDNGAETNIFSALLGMQLFAEHGYRDEVSPEYLKERFKVCTGGNSEAFMAISDLDNIPQTAAETVLTPPSNPSKFLLWQDILLGLFDRHVEGMDLEAYYSEVSKKLSQYQANGGEWAFVFEMPAQLANVLRVKSQIGNRIRRHYIGRELEALNNIRDHDLPDLLSQVRHLKHVHQAQWFKTCKPFGWDVIDMRYGGLMSRIDTAIQRLSAYVTGEVDIIEELEEERLYFDGPVRPEGTLVGNCNNYRRIASACPT